ncbi:MAG TPA: DNA repair helicase XPB [Planctomycetota bacterium]|nr:DNA repair helicase XPB [Planctomycetota bacterium]
MSDGAALSDGDLLLLETAHPRFDAARDELAPIAETVKTPEALHTYRLTPLSIWNAAATGMRLEDVVGRLRRNLRLGLSPALEELVSSWFRRYGAIVLRASVGGLELEARDDATLDRVLEDQEVRSIIIERTGARARVPLEERGRLKQALVRTGYPARDLAGYASFQPLDIRMKVPLRPYQQEALDAFFGSDEAGSGVLVLPCGAGKTVIGLAAIARVGCEALVVTSNTQAARQWAREAVEKTSLREDQVGEYSGAKKLVRPLTVTTYSLLITRPRGSSRDQTPPHLELLSRAGFGMVVYDEIHLLPAPVFRATAAIQAKRRLGLTATLVREDGHEADVFALVGPKRAEVAWKRLEALRFLAEARCLEVRVPLAPSLRDRYAFAGLEEAFRIAATNPRKEEVALALMERHQDEPVLVIGTYLDQLERISKASRSPLVTGATPEGERERLYRAFRTGEEKALCVSKVANFAIDLPDASVAIELSGTYGSRQEEAQRLGRVLRPKSDGRGALFYALVTDETRELDMAQRRQRFLLEQGYRYDVLAASELLASSADPALGLGPAR